jgi:hypothetical protein
MSSEIDVAPEFVCLSFNVWGTRNANGFSATLALENNQ